MSLILGLLFCVPAFSETAVVSLLAKPTYAVGETAILRAQLLTRPDNSNFEFDLVGRLNDVEVPIERITEFEAFSEVRDLEAGSFHWAVDVYVQDKRLAADLKTAISSFTAEIETIDAELGTATDPDRIAYLESQKARFERLRAASLSQLASIRSHVHGPVSINFSVLQ